MSDLKEIVETTGHGIFATDPRAMVIDAVAQMCRLHVRTLLVGAVTDPIGIISKRDVLERIILMDRDPKTTRVEVAMSQPLLSLPEDSTPVDALAFLRDHRLHQVPILSDEAVIGVVSSTDLMRWATDALDREIRALNEYCAGKYPG